MISEFVGGEGITLEEIEEIRKKISEMNLSKDLKHIGLANDAELKEIGELSREILDSKKYESLVVVGIGGALLSSKTLHLTLNHKHYNDVDSETRGGLKIYFIGNSTDPIELHNLFLKIDPQKTLFCIISKSGTTIETMSTFLYIRNILKSQIGDFYKDRFILLAGSSGNLREFAEKEDMRSLKIAGPIGDRFAVLTKVGLFPAALTGIDIEYLLKGAKDLNEEIAKTFASIHYLFHQKGKGTVVLMPYSVRLETLSRWFRQLFAESSGKNTKGFTPINAAGPEDQHSQLQLYQEGPMDKVVNFMKLGKFSEDYHLSTLEDIKVEDAKYFGGHSFSEIINTEHKATSLSLMQSKRPNATLILPEINEHTLGQALYFFELAMLYLGKLLEIDPFNQPGVEKSKDYIYGELGRKGYEGKKKELSKLEKSIGKYVV